MKSATVFLVALTLSTAFFLESFTAAVDSTTRKETIKVNEAVKQFLDEKLTSNEMLIASTKKYAVDALLTAEVGEECLTKIIIWLKTSLKLVKNLHDEMNNVLDSGTVEQLEKVSVDISVAIALKKVEWSELYEPLPNSEVKQNLNEKLTTIFANAYVIDFTLKGVLYEVKNQSNK